MRAKKKLVEIEVHQWFCNGDHPEDGLAYQGQTWEGEVVGYYRRPDDDGNRECEECGFIMHDHGRIDTMEGGHIVCPGDYIITGVNGEKYPCKPDVFHKTYDIIDACEE